MTVTDSNGGPTTFRPPDLLAAIAQGTDDAIFAKDLAGRYRFANPATLAALGRAEGEVLGRTDAELVADREAARRIRENDRRVLAGESIEFEEVITLRNGALRCWLSRKMPLRDAAGDIVGLLGIARDITVRKEAQARAESDRLKLQMAMQAAGLVTAEIDYRSNENHISAELARLMELGDTEMVVPRQAIFDRIHPDDRDRYLEAIRRTVDPAGNGHLSIKVRTLTPSGTIRWLHIVLQVTFSMLDGQMKPDRGYCAAADVTAETIAERRALAAQRLTESVVENAGALVYAKDLAGRFILSNQAWRHLHGLTAEQAQRVTDVQVFGAAVAAQLRENDRRVIASGEPVVAHEKAVVRGRAVTYRSHKFPLYDDAGKVYAVCGVSTDITDVVEAERRKDEFIATLAHELRNPLAPIRNGLEILKRVPGLPETAGKVRDMMDRQLTHLVRLVDDLLDVSRITRDKLEMRVEPLTLQQIVDHAVEASRPSIDAARHALSVSLPPHAVHLEGDLTRLAQVVSNLLNNAAKYTPPGGRIEVAARMEEGDRVLIEVRDDGAGIAPDVLPHVFELFAQGDGMKKHAQGGMGIGLWLVKKLVELHRGSVEARSAGTGEGSTFSVRLPARMG